MMKLVYILIALFLNHVHADEVNDKIVRLTYLNHEIQRTLSWGDENTFKERDIVQKLNAIAELYEPISGEFRRRSPGLAAEIEDMLYLNVTRKMRSQSQPSRFLVSRQSELVDKVRQCLKCDSWHSSERQSYANQVDQSNVVSRLRNYLQENYDVKLKPLDVKFVVDVSCDDKLITFITDEYNNVIVNPLKAVDCFKIQPPSRSGVTPEAGALR